MKNPSKPTPDIAKLTARLTADNARVGRYVESLVGRIDRLVEATANDDWGEVRRLSENLVRSSQVYGFPTIKDRAEVVCGEMGKPDNTLEIKRSVLRLIGACGRARVPGQGSDQKTA